MLSADCLLPGPVLRRLERVFIDALTAGSRAAHLLYDDEASRADAGLALLRALAALPHTRHSAGNPYLRLCRELPGLVAPVDGPTLLRAMRPVLVTAFSYAVPTDEVLERIASWQSVVEVGAGGGYWARCLTDRGATVTAFDRVLPFDQLRPGGRLHQHHPVAVGGPSEALAAATGARALLLCWPPGVINREEADAGALPIFSPMGDEALDRFTGEHLVFVGDHVKSFGSPAFFARLEREWILEERLALPNLGSWRDAAYVLRRRGSPLV